MASNHMLTAVIKGRTVTDIVSEGPKCLIHFDDGSVMTVKTDGTAPASTPRGPVKAVRQRDTAFDIDLEDGGTIAFTTAEPTSSVMLRDSSGAMEYAD
jgi:hypothetical protein